MSEFSPSGIVTMTTDFGHKGPFAGVMRGVMLSRYADLTIVDLAHDIPAHWPPEAGFWIRRSYSYFPSGTVHIAIVDPGVGTERDILAVEHDGHIFVAPDNGLLESVIALANGSGVYNIDVNSLSAIGISEPSPTFHGRDIFAPVAAELAAGRLALNDIATETQQWTPGWVNDPEVSGDEVSGVVVSIDAFGNLITNIEGPMISSIQQPVVRIAGHKLDIKVTYGRAKPGDFLALVNSFGVLEIARAEGSAADGLGAERGAPVTVSTPG